jgi:hypothetical protein
MSPQIPCTCSYPLMTSRALYLRVPSGFVLVLYTHHPIGLLWVYSTRVKVWFSNRDAYSCCIAAFHCRLRGLFIASLYVCGSSSVVTSAGRVVPALAALLDWLLISTKGCDGEAFGAPSGTLCGSSADASSTDPIPIGGGIVTSDGSSTGASSTGRVLAGGVTAGVSNIAAGSLSGCSGAVSGFSTSGGSSSPR